MMTTQELDAEQKAFIEWYESESDEEQPAATKIVDSIATDGLETIGEAL